MFNLENVKNLGVKEEDVMKLLNLYQYKGKDIHYVQILEKDQDKIIKKNTNLDILEIIKLYNLDISDARKKYIIKNGGSGKNKSEQFMINTKKVLYKFVSNYMYFELESYEFARFVEELFDKIEVVKPAVYDIQDSSNSLFNKKAKGFKRDDLDKLLNLFCQKKDSKEYEITNLIANFYIDFVNQNIFTAHNDIIGLFILYMLLIVSGFTVFRYISFFELFNAHYEDFKDAMIMANTNYAEGYSNPIKMNKFLVNIVLEAYEKLENFMHEYSYDTKISKENEIIGLIYHLPQEFTKDDIRKASPFVSDSTINRALNSLACENKIRSLGTGRSAKWIRLVEKPTFETKQTTSIFDFTGEEEESA